MFGIAVAVAVVPEALPAVVTISLWPSACSAWCGETRCPPAAGGRDARQHLGDLHRQDRHVDPRRDDRPQHLDRRPRRSTSSGSGYEPDGDVLRTRAGRRRSGPVRELLRPPHSPSDARLCRTPRTERMERQGRPDRGALVVAAAKAGLDKAELDCGAPARRRRSRSRPSQADDHLHETPDGWSPTPRARPRSSCAPAPAGSRRRTSDRLDRAPTARPCWTRARSWPPRRFACWPSPAAPRATLEDAETRDDAPRPRRHDRPAPARGAGRDPQLLARRHQAGDDHRRPPADGASDRPRARAARLGPGCHRAPSWTR